MVIPTQWPILLLMGGIGAFTKDVLKDNKIQLPEYKDGYIYLGFLGGIVIGGMAGYLVDNDPITAFLGGYAGKQIIESLINKRKKED